MKKRTKKRSTNLQGVASLTADAIIGITDIAESLHLTITSLAGLLAAPGQTRTRGITGMVYRTIRTVTKFVGKGIENQIPSPDPSLPSPTRQAMLSALNGVLGDHLVERNNPLAIPMQFRQNGKPLTEQELTEAIQRSNGKLLILVHGSCLNDLQWNRKGHDHGAALARDLGLEPIYLHYNSGLHISENGEKFSALLETIIEQSPQPIELFMIAHSMGGLITRSACHYGKVANHTWLNQLQKLIFLGTPHHGALLEKGGNWINTFLEISAYSSPFSRLGKVRSCGVTDLRYGNVLESDWKEQDRFEISGDQRTPVPLPENVECYSIAATTGKKANKLNEELIGDSLVTLNSALGRHQNPAFNLLFPESNQWVGRNMNHMDLLNHMLVYEMIKKWLATNFTVN